MVSSRLMSLTGLRVSKMTSGFDDLDPFVEAIVDAFGVERCVWGSDWPYINTPRRPTYAELLAPVARWFPGADAREKSELEVVVCVDEPGEDFE